MLDWQTLDCGSSLEEDGTRDWNWCDWTGKNRRDLVWSRNRNGKEAKDLRLKKGSDTYVIAAFPPVIGVFGSNAGCG